MIVDGDGDNNNNEDNVVMIGKIIILYHFQILILLIKIFLGINYYSNA